MTFAQHRIEAHEVYPKLWVGSFVTQSLRWHFDTVVLCANEHQEELDIETIKAPFDDGPLDEQTKRVALAAAGRVARRLKSGKRVLVTCHAGRNRSALVAALALMQLGFPAHKAIDTIRARRVCLYGSTPLQNKHFETWLLALGRRMAS